MFNNIQGNDACALEQIRTNNTWSAEDNVEIQTVNTDGRVVLDTKINVFLDTETKVAGVGEVLFPQLVFTNFQSSFEDLLSLGSTDCAVDGNLFVTTNAERTDGVSGFGEDGLLASKLFQDLINEKH